MTNGLRSKSRIVKLIKLKKAIKSQHIRETSTKEEELVQTSAFSSSSEGILQQIHLKASETSIASHGSYDDGNESEGSGFDTLLPLPKIQRSTLGSVIVSTEILDEEDTLESLPPKQAGCTPEAKRPVYVQTCNPSADQTTDEDLCKHLEDSSDQGPGTDSDHDSKIKGCQKDVNGTPHLSKILSNSALTGNIVLSEYNVKTAASELAPTEEVQDSKSNEQRSNINITGVKAILIKSNDGSGDSRQQVKKEHLSRTDEPPFSFSETLVKPTDIARRFSSEQVGKMPPWMQELVMRKKKLGTA